MNKIAIALLSVIGLAACDSSENAQRNVVHTSPAPSVFYSKADMAEGFLRCVINERDDDFCEEQCADDHSIGVCDDIEDSLTFFAKNKSELRFVASLDQHDQDVVVKYLSEYAVDEDDDEAELACAEVYGDIACDDVEDRYERFTSNDGMSTSEAVMTGVAAGVIGDKYNKSKHSKVSTKGKVTTVHPKAVIKTTGKTLNGGSTGFKKSVNSTSVKSTVTKPKTVIKSTGKSLTGGTTGIKKVATSPVSKPAISLSKSSTVKKASASSGFKKVVKKTKPAPKPKKKKK